MPVARARLHDVDLILEVVEENLAENTKSSAGRGLSAEAEPHQVADSLAAA